MLTPGENSLPLLLIVNCIKVSCAVNMNGSSKSFSLAKSYPSLDGRFKTLWAIETSVFFRNIHHYKCTKNWGLISGVQESQCCLWENHVVCDADLSVVSCPIYSVNDSPMQVWWCHLRLALNSSFASIRFSCSRLQELVFIVQRLKLFFYPSPPISPTSQALLGRTYILLFWLVLRNSYLTASLMRYKINTEGGIPRRDNHDYNLISNPSNPSLH